MKRKAFNRETVEVCSVWDIPALNLPDRASEIWPVKEPIATRPAKQPTPPSPASEPRGQPAPPPELP